MRFTHFWLILALAGAALLAAVPQQKNSSGEVLLGAALHQEEVEGNLEAAITAYQEFLAQRPSDRAMAAKAQFRIGACYEKLGKREARKAYEEVLKKYADQGEIAAQARARLAELSKAAGGSGSSVMSVRKIWSDPIVDLLGEPSPDGRYLSFVDWETGDVAIRDLRTGSNRRLTHKGSWEDSDAFAEFSRWSPDGKQLAYDWFNDDESIDARVINLSGGEPKVVIRYPKGSWSQVYDWSPDGKQILLFVEYKDETCQIALVSAADGSSKVLKKFDQNTRFPHNMRFSSDGRYIAYDHRQQENAPEYDISLLPVDGTGEAPLVAHPAHDALLGWVPDGKRILFASDRTGSMGIWSVPVGNGMPEGAPRVIKPDSGPVVPLGFTRKGSFYYGYTMATEDVYSFKLDPASGDILVPPAKLIQRFEGLNSWPRYSPDGKFLAYVSVRGRMSALPRYRSNLLSIHSLETGQEREFATEFRRLAAPRWSGDGRSIFIAAWDHQNRQGLYEVNVETGEFTPVVMATDGFRFTHHEVSPDGKAFFYVRRNSEKDSCQIMLRDLRSGDEKELFRAPYRERVRTGLSPDGRWLALINNVSERKVLRVLSTAGGEPREIVRYEASRSSNPPVEWSADGKYLFFARSRPEEKDSNRDLWRVPVQGGEPQKLGVHMRGFTDLTLHPDGQRIAFSSRGSEPTPGEVWVMENFLPEPVSKR